jgi:hypothetical protein
MSSKLSRTILFTLFALALLAVAPVFAEPAPAGGCGAPNLDLFAPVTAAPQVTPASQVTAPALPDFMTTFRGYCKCSCSFTPNCNTSADCGGSACLKGITCC